MPPQIPGRPEAALAGQGARFLAFGLFNTGLTYGLYCLLVFFLHPQLAYAIVFALGIALAFAGNAAFVFRAPLRREAFAPYAAFYLAQYALNAGLIHVFIERLGWGPRSALAAALAIVTPLSFLANRHLLAPAERRAHGILVRPGGERRLGPGVPVAAAGAVAALYLAGLGGFWLGDDVPNLHRAWMWAEDGASWARTAALFAAAVPSEGAFYRPLTLATFAANHALAGADFAGWHAVNLAVHLANTGLVALLAFRMAERSGAQGRRAALVAALAFGLAPAAAEGVYWVSARADGWVLLCALLAAERWTREAEGAGGREAIAAVLACVVALGFKESAAVVPLQLALLAWAWPAPPRRARTLALGAALALVPAYLAFRALVLDSAWQVYAPPGADAGAVSRALAGFASLPAWWEGFAAGSPRALATAWPALLAAAALAALASARGLRGRLALALAAAGGGMLAATFANLGSLPASGEGGRLLYASAAWFALALAVALAPARDAKARLAARAGLACAVAAVLSGTALLHDALARALATQDSNRRLVAALPAWAEAHPGLTLLVVPDRAGAVVALRNAQGGIALAPLQSRPLLHRVLPTLPGEIPLRHGQLAGGLATRLAELVPVRADAALLPSLARPAAARWPETIACWSPAQSRIVPIPAPDPADAEAWSAAILASARGCGL